MMQQLGNDNVRKTRLFLVFFMGAFVCYALYVVLFGTLSTSMMSYYAINTGAQGAFTMIGSIGGIAAALFCALAGERFSKLWAIALGTMILGAATLVVGFAPPYLAVCVCSLFCGIGYTVIDVMGNSAVTEYFPDRSKTLLPMIQILFGVGTMAGPFLATSLLSPGLSKTFVYPFLLIGGISLVMTAVYAGSLKKALPYLPKIDLKQMAASAKQNPAEIFRSWKSWAILLSCSLFCCFNTSIVAWYPTFFNLERGMGAEGAALMLTLFYAGILGMRLISPLLFRKISPQRVYVLFSIASIACMLVAINTQNIALSMVFTVIGGGFQALNIVSVIMIATTLFPARKASASALAVFSYNIGGMIAPFLVGMIAETTGLQFPLSLMCGVFGLGIAVMGFLSKKCHSELHTA
ncbi:MAG: MFS transporter [Christensenella sp.]|nr:MFS transporter [Christensenella sp.]